MHKILFSLKINFSVRIIIDPQPSSSSTQPVGNPEIRFDWKSTECLLTQRPVLPKRPLPDDCRDTNSLLIDKQATPITDSQIFETFKTSMIGVSFRPKRQYLQIFFQDMSTAERTLQNGPYQIGSHTLPLFPPKGKLAPRIIIQLGNVPILPRSTVEQAIRDTFSPHMTVIEAVPFTIKHTPIMTSRWAMVVEPPRENPDLDGVKVIHKILGKTVLASWPGSLPTCLSCMDQHGTKDCPKRQPQTPSPDRTYANAAGV